MHHLEKFGFWVCIVVSIYCENLEDLEVLQTREVEVGALDCLLGLGGYRVVRW